MATWLLSSGVAMCVNTCGLATSCCKMHCDGCMNVAWGLCWEEAGARNRVFFPCKVAAAGDERSCVRRLRLGSFRGQPVPPVCPARSGCSCVRVVLYVSWICGCRSHWNGCKIVVIWCCHLRRYMRVSHLMLQNALWWLHECCMGLVLEEAGERNLVFFRVKWLQLAMKGTSCVRPVRFGSFRGQSVPPLCPARSGCSCVRSSIRFLNLWLQIALEWLHDCCHLVLPCA